MKDKRNDIYSGIALILFAVFMYATSYMIQPTTSDVLGSRFFPQVVAVLIAVLAVCMIVSGAAALRKTEKNVQAEKEESEKKSMNMPLLLTVIGLIVYYILIVQIGFTITSIVYLLFQGSVLMSKEELKDKKKLITLVLVSIIVPVALNAIFWNAFKIALPAGKLFQ